MSHRKCLYCTREFGLYNKIHIYTLFVSTVGFISKIKYVCNCLLLRPGPPHRVSDVHLSGLTVESGCLGEVRMRDPVLAVMVMGHMLRDQGGRVAGRSGYQCLVDVPG